MCGMIGTNILNLRVTFSAGMCVLVCVYVGKSMERKKETIAIEVTFILFPTCVFSIHFFMSSVIVVCLLLLCEAFIFMQNICLNFEPVTVYPYLFFNTVRCLYCMYTTFGYAHRSFIYLFTDLLGNCLCLELRIQISNQTNQNVFICILLLKNVSLANQGEKCEWK